MYRKWKAVNAMTIQGSFVKFSKIQDMVCFCPFLDWLIPNLQGQMCSVRIGVNVGSKHSKRKKDDFTFKTMKTCIGEYSLSQFYQHYFWETSQKQDYSLIYWNKICLIFIVVSRSKGNRCSRQFIFTERTYWSLEVYGWGVVAYIFWHWKYLDMLEDCINAIWDNGVNDDTLSVILY